MTVIDWANAPITGVVDARQMFDALQARAATAGLALRAPPPEPSSCCGRGCNGCVWEGYYAAVAYWRDEALLMLD
ncbi:oxidoreductase [Rhodoferax koreense]|uniref:Oxidoreductase n=1 Tax=Rhodoferax koreensis TaxID=1842727 RepID=A0A1P8JSL4_9BURK|nr:oxidoreductase-like domain-containing protein [Rhodoferax koreense]APW36753.1 oxidoreductase [Rhodoferax koreense]